MARRKGGRMGRPERYVGRGNRGLPVQDYAMPIGAILTIIVYLQGRQNALISALVYSAGESM